jgi:RHS repeat-associated protein
MNRQEQAQNSQRVLRENSSTQIIRGLSTSREFPRRATQLHASSASDANRSLSRRYRARLVRVVQSAPQLVALVLVLSFCMPVASLFAAPRGSRITRGTIKKMIPRARAARAGQSGDALSVYGPRRFDRVAGSPTTVTESFALPSNAVPPFILIVQNGAPDGSARVSSATIRLNSVEVFAQRDFNQNVATLTKQVPLVATNRLEVTLSSAVGSFLTITVTTLVASLSSLDPARAVQGQTLNVTLHGHNTRWAAGQTRASFGGEVVVGGASPGEPGSVTVLDQVTAVAQVSVSPTAALAPRNVVVSTLIAGESRTEIEILADSFTVEAVTPPGAAAATVTTLAGVGGTAGFADGVASQAQFNQLAGIAVGADDSIYVADAGNHRIRVARSQTDASGNVVLTVSTLAGDGTAGFADGAGTATRFNNPQGVAVDAAGVVYVADTGNNRVRRIATDGSVTTLAGDGAIGFTNGAGAQARFNAPRGVAVDNAGNVYVADTGNSAVRSISPAGLVATVAGDGTVGSTDAPAVRFDGLIGIAVEGTTLYIYVADTGNHRIRRLTSSGVSLTIAGVDRGFADGSAAQARFAEPSGIAIDGAGRIIVADATNSLVRMVDVTKALTGAAGAVTTVAGTGGRGLVNGAGNAAKFFTPRGVAVTASSAMIVADTGNHVLRKITLPPVITALNPAQAQAGQTITIAGERFDARVPSRNSVLFVRAAQAGGGTTAAQVISATQTQLTVTVPQDAATGSVTVQTEGGTAVSPAPFTLVIPPPSITDYNPKHGPVGTLVTLTGSNLTAGAATPAVTFAGANGARLNALVNSASATQVRVTVPNAAVTGFIQLTNANGSATTNQPFTVDGGPLDYQLTLAPSVAAAVQHTSATFIVYATGSSPAFSQLIALSATGLPAGVSAMFEPAQVTAGATATLTLNLANASLAAGSYSFTVRGSAPVDGSEMVRTAAASLSVIAAGQTTLSGRVLSTDNEPVIGATASLDGKSATTDAAGTFLLAGVNAGVGRPLMIDGRTAAAPNRTYPVITEPATIVAGQANVNPFTFYLPPVDTQYEVEVIPGQNTVATNPRVPGLQMTIPAGANLRNRDGSPVARASITPLAIDRTPAPLPANVGTTLVFTSQPGGAVADIAMPVVYPNLAGADPGTRVELYAFNHDTVQWYVYGYGRVSADGRSIVPEIDPATGRQYGLRDFSWHFANVAPAGNPGDSSSKNGCSENRTGRPVDLSTGMKIETAVDIKIGGARGGLVLTRIYTGDLALLANAALCPFGAGWTHNYAVRLTGSFAQGGAGRVAFPEQVTGHLFSYARTDPDGALIFTATATPGQLGDVVRKLPGGTYEYRYKEGGLMRFDSSGRLTAMVDRNGNTTTLTYTGANLTQITDAVGRSITLSYDSSGQITQATDPLGRTWRYEGGGLLTKVTDPLNQVTRYGYEVSANRRDLTLVTDKRGIVAKRITYDSFRRVARQEYAEGGYEQYDYTMSGTGVTTVTITDSLGRKASKRFNAEGYAIEMTDTLGQTGRIDRDIATSLPLSTSGPCGCAESTRQFDERGNVIAVTDRLGQTTRFEYEPVFNQLAKITDKLGRVTRFSYDSRGNLISITDALNQTASLQYDGYGQVIAVTDPLGHTKRMEYDGLGNVTAIVDPLGNRSTMEYDAAGRLLAATDPLNRRVTTIYDALNRVHSMTDQTGATTTLEYDENGNLTSATNALGHQVRNEYDNRNRVVRMTDAAGNVGRIVYDTESQVASVVSPLGRTTLYGYDKRGRMVTMQDPMQGLVRMTYDNRGNVIAISDQRGSTTTFTYDELYRPVSTRDPLGRKSTVTYDPMNRVTETVDRLGRHVTMSYDALDRLLATAYADATVNYTYDVDSRVTRIDDTQGGSVQWTYDAADRLLTETTAAGVVRYAYNAASQMVTMMAADRPVVSYGYDTAGRLHTIAQGSETFTYAYDTISRLTSMQRPNGVTTSYDYDANSRLTHLLHGTPGAAVEEYRYTYNADSEIETVTSLASLPLLTQARSASAADAANRISQFGAANYTSDELGQTTKKTDAAGTTTYQWDARGRLTGVSLPDGQAVSYGYDALGRRASRTANGATTSFLYDGADVVLDRRGDGSSVDYLNGFGIDDKLRQTSAAGTHYYLQDHLGSTVALTDAAGAVAERQQYQTLGASSGSALTRYGFTGRELDETTGLMYYRARWYDPQQGRFITEDPVGFAGGMNFYAYVRNNPLNATDPSGLMPAPYEIADWLDQWIDCLERGLNGLPGMRLYNDVTNWWNSRFPTLRAANPRELAQLLRQLADMLRVGTTIAEVYRNGEGFWGWAYAVAREAKRAADLFLLLGGLGQAFLEARAAAAAAEAEGTGMTEAPVPQEEPPVPPVIFRSGNPNPGNLTPRPIDQGNLSFRDSLSNPYPLEPGQKPVFGRGDSYFGVDTSKLPPGSVIPDNTPPGHVTVRGVPPEALKDAVIPGSRGKFPK